MLVVSEKDGFGMSLPRSEGVDLSRRIVSCCTKFGCGTNTCDQTRLDSTHCLQAPHLASLGEAPCRSYGHSSWEA